MMYTFLTIEKSDTVASISLNRPERYNALNKVLCQEITQAIESLSTDRSVHVIRLKGEGKGFCAGLDLFEVDIEELKDAGKIVTELFNPIVLAIKSCPKPVVAQVTGVAAGAGCSLALACDVVFAGQNASFSLPFLKIALLPDTGASYFLVQQLGYKKAFEIFASNGALSASEAAQCNLINRVEDDNTLDEVCLAFCKTLSFNQTESLANLKSLLQAAETEGLTNILNLEAYYQDQAAKLPFFEMAVKKFKERK